MARPRLSDGTVLLPPMQQNNCGTEPLRSFTLVQNRSGFANGLRPNHPHTPRWHGQELAQRLEATTQDVSSDARPLGHLWIDCMQAEYLTNPMSRLPCSASTEAPPQWQPGAWHFHTHTAQRLATESRPVPHVLHQTSRHLTAQGDETELP